jgi:beta-lactam-binding protein with PASTA domain
VAAAPRVGGDLVPDVRLLEGDRAAEVLERAGFTARVEGRGGRVAAQEPPAGTPARRGALVVVTLTPEAGGADVVVPDLRGLPVRDALSRLSALAIPVGRVVGSGSVVTQTPEPGRPVRPDTRCTLTLAPRGT